MTIRIHQVILTLLTALLAGPPEYVAANPAPQPTGQGPRPTGLVYDTSDNPFMTTPSKYGDPFPAYFDGRWHLYTLQGDIGSVRHLTSRDLVHWAEQEEAMTGGGIATGMVVRQGDVFYLFYTIGQGGIGLVTSNTPWYFDKGKSQTVVKPGPHCYPGATTFRDASVFYNQDEQVWWLLCEAHSPARGVEVALLKAKQLEGPWKAFPALYTQPKDGSKLSQYVSCPQLIQQDGAWYLTYLNNATSYHVADSPAGPWTERKGQYNSDFLTAGSRSGTDGTRHLNWGFFSVRPTPENPNAQPRYGGPIGVGREMVFGADRTIGVRPLPELIEAIRAPRHNAEVMTLFKPLSGTWDQDSENRKLECGDANGGMAILDLPDGRSDYYFEAEIRFGEKREDVSVTVRSTAAQDSGYRVALRPADGIFEITEHAGERRPYLSEPHTFGETAHLKIFVCDGQLEAFLDGWSDLSTRVLQMENAKILLEAGETNVSFTKPLVHYFNQQETSRAGLEPLQEEPVFSLEPHQTRMATCYRDKGGVYHLFADYMENSSISWTAEIRHYTSSDLRDWTFAGTAVPKGEGDEADAYGAASPHVLATNGRVYLFYAGRANPLGGPANLAASRGEAGHVAGHIMLASARADDKGAPVGPFTKDGIVLAPGDTWDAMRLDDPCVVLEGDVLHLYFKGFDTNRQLDHVKAGYARARLSEMKFTKHATPVLSAPGGGEMPRVFLHNGQWHLFYHHFGGGTSWRHYRGEAPEKWALVDPKFFNGHPSGGPRDIMMIYGMDGQLPGRFNRQVQR